MAMSKLKQIERMVKIDKPKASSTKTFHFRPTLGEKSYLDVLKVKNLSVGYKESLCCFNFSLEDCFAYTDNDAYLRSLSILGVFKVCLNHIKPADMEVPLAGLPFFPFLSPFWHAGGLGCFGSSLLAAGPH